MTSQSDKDLSRRTTDKVTKALTETEERIVDLIEAAQDPKDKAYLFILLKINSSLGDNTMVVHEVADNVNEVALSLHTHLQNFNNHILAEADIHSRESERKKIWTWVGRIAQTIVFAVVGYFQVQLADINLRIAQLENKLANHVADNRVTEATVAKNLEYLQEQKNSKVK